MCDKHNSISKKRNFRVRMDGINGDTFAVYVQGIVSHDISTGVGPLGDRGNKICGKEYNKVNSSNNHAVINH